MSVVSKKKMLKSPLEDEVCKLSDEVARLQIMVERCIRASEKSSTIAQQLIDIIPVAANIYQQRMQMKAQMQRMERGLPPIDFEQYSPPVQARVGVDNRTMYLLIGGAALFGALMLIRRNR